jgi:zinc transporter ZupT
MKKEKKKLKNAALAFLLNLGGGVLIANCFCHWLPEVREGIEGTNIDTFLPLAEVVMCSGFFFICGLEELLHHFLHPHQAPAVKLESVTTKETTLNGCDPGKPGPDQCEEEKKEEKSAAQIKAAIR